MVLKLQRHLKSAANKEKRRRTFLQIETSEKVKRSLHFAKLKEPLMFNKSQGSSEYTASEATSDLMNPL